MLNSLQYLQIDGGSIQDIRPVSNITRLYLSNTTWTNLAQLSGFIKLKSLILQNPAITDLSSLPALPNLNQIMLDGPIKDLSPLHRLPQLSSLGLDCTGISDLSQISSFSNLQELSLGDNGIVDISPLSSLKCLTFLSLSANSISDLDALRGLNNLDVLDLCDNHVSNIEPISQDHISGLLGLLSNPLDANAYNLYIPLLMQNNPTLSIAYDPTPEISTKYLFAIPTLFTAFLNRRFWKTTLAFWGHHIHLHRPEATRPEMSTVPPELFEDFHFANLILCG
jgi:Leucine-rich repeat (LRR) protein